MTGQHVWREIAQHVWREIEIKMAALQAKRKILAIFAILELLEDDKIS